jgi:hypothetical protein
MILLKRSYIVALHLPVNGTDLNLTELVCGDIRDKTASTNLKEMEMFCEKVFNDCTEEK